MMNFFTKLLTPVFIALGMVSPTPVVETPASNTQVQQELIELRQKVQELEAEKLEEEEEEEEEETEIITEVEVKIPEPKPVEVKKEVEVKINPIIESTEPIIEDVPVVEVTQIIEEEIDTPKQDKFEDRNSDKRKKVLKNMKDLPYSSISARALSDAIDSKYKSAECEDILNDIDYIKVSEGATTYKYQHAYRKYITLKDNCVEIEYPDDRYKVAEDNLIENKFYSYKKRINDTADSEYNDYIIEEANSWGVDYEHLLITFENFK